MDFRFSDDEQMIIDAVRELCDEELKPNAQETDAKGEYPWDKIQLLRDMDLFGIPVPEEYNGLGMNFLLWGVVGEMLSTACTNQTQPSRSPQQSLLGRGASTGHPRGYVGVRRLLARCQR